MKFRFRLFLSAVLAMASSVTVFAQSTEYVPSKENLQAREEFRNSHFGIFIHWGIYSMLGHGEWVMQNENINHNEYSLLARGFNPSKFNAKEWVRDIKASGASYITITSRHHDGFSMFDSKASDYNIVKATPFGRDILKELADACADEGIKLHFYYSHLDWGRDDYSPLGRTGHGTGRENMGSHGDAHGEKWQHYLDFMDAQLTELLTGYGPVGAIWFDGVWDKDEYPRECQEEIWNLRHQYDLIHSLQPACLVGNNHHLLPFEGEDIQIFERDLPGKNEYGLSGQEVSVLPLETCQTMNRTWGYRITDKDYKSSDFLIKYLVRTVGSGANLLLNIGPRPDGTLPEEAVERLHAMGEWLSANRSTVFETENGLFPEQEWGVITRKGNSLFVHILKNETGGNKVCIPLAAHNILEAKSFTDGTDIAFVHTPEGIELAVPEFSENIPDYIIEVKLAELSDEERNYLEFLYGAMPLPDMTGYDFNYWLENVRKTLAVRSACAWTVPEREFRHFVLPLRVNNEALDDFRTLYADELCRRIAGMNAEEAALEINHWCHEMATYTPTDGRTLPPTGTIKAGLGRCGEESVLAVAALRAAGIPARQVYTPRWAHTDDNHAWVEVYVDGNWHFMGACEPEAVLDLAWFNAPVSRAMLLHTLAFGNYDGPEDVIRRTRSFTEINVIKSYIPTRRTTVVVRNTDGSLVENAEVEFKIYNYAEFYTVARQKTASDGSAALDTGLGDMLVSAYKDGRFGIAKAAGTSTDIILDHFAGEEFGLDFEIIPPHENPIPSRATEAQAAENSRRLAEEDAIRAARPKGNDAVLDAFRKAHKGKNASALLSSLSDKDMGDVRLDVLEDAMAHCGKKFSTYRDCPRVSIEPLLPYFSEIGNGLEATDANAVLDWTLANIKVDDSLNPQGIRIPPVTVWRSRMADSRSRNIFFVAACRSKGIEARIDEITGKTQYREEGVWKDVKWNDQSPEVPVHGSVTASYEPISWLRNPLYYKHFTISRIENGRAVLLAFDEYEELGYNEIMSKPYQLEEGYYMLTSGIRMADGSVSAHLQFFNVRQEENTHIPLILKADENNIAVIGNIDAEQKYLPSGQHTETSILSTTGRGYFAIAIISDFSEPSIHALRQLAASSDALNNRGFKLMVLCKDEKSCRRCADYLKGIKNISYGIDKDDKVRTMIFDGCKLDKKEMPLITVADSFGRVVYKSQGYNTSLSEHLRSLLPAL